MWTCPKCDRIFQKHNQSHICVKKDVGELFVDRPDELVLAWDKLHQSLMEWKPQAFAATTKSIVYTSKKAWLIIRPHKRFIDLRFYHSVEQNSPRIRRKVDYQNKFAHHIKVEHEDQIDGELIDLLREAFENSLIS